MRLSNEQKAQIDLALGHLGKCLSEELKEKVSAKKGIVKIDHNMLETITKVYLTDSDGIMNLLLDSGILNESACPVATQCSYCPCVAVCTFSTR